MLMMKRVCHPPTALRASLFPSFLPLKPSIITRQYSSQQKPLTELQQRVQEEMRQLKAKKQPKPNAQQPPPPPPIPPKFAPWMRHLGTFVAFAAISFGVSVYSIEADDPLFYTRKLPERLEPLRGSDTEQKKAVLHDLAKYTQTNDLIKTTIVQKGYLSLLLQLVETGDTVEIKNLAARIVGNLCLEVSNKEKIVQSAELKKIIVMLRDDGKHLDMPLYARKALAMALAHLCTEEKLRIHLAQEGVPSTLMHVQENDQLKRQYFNRAIAHIAATVVPKINSSDFTVSSEDIEILRKAYTEEEQRGSLGKVQNTLVDNGLTMYLHTSIGGAVWGACEALRKKETFSKVARSAARTALVTGLVPIYFVGMGVSLYNYYQRQVDSSEQRFYLTLVTTMGLYPWVYLLPIVERFSPYWLGGHVLGFTSFFMWLLISKNDVLKSDNLLASQDEIQARKQIKSAH